MYRKEVVVAVLTTASAIVAATAILLGWQGRNKERRRERAQQILRKFAKDSATPVPLLWQVADALASDMEASLSASASDQKSSDSTLNMLVSFLDALPTGKEEGIFYGVNLRSKDLLLVSARLGGNNNPISDLHRQEISFPSHVLQSETSQEVFDFVASKVAEFMAEYPGVEPEKSKIGKGLGFTISYPVGQSPTKHTSASENTAIKWKSFLVDDPVQDQKQLLGEINCALKKHGVEMQAFALVTDPAGDLAGGRYYSQDCVAAVTLGMGTSAAYTELAESVPRSRWLGVWPKSGEILVTMGWGNFRCPHFPITEFDSCLDSESSNPGTQIFEKLVSGTYLGETVRRVLLKMAQEASLYGNKVPVQLKTPYILRSSDLAAMHQDASEDREVVAEKLESIFEITGTTLMAREMVAEVCDVVAERGARLAAAAVVGIIKKLKRVNDKKSIVTIEGELYEQYRVFRNYLHSAVWEMLGKELSDNIVIEHSHGGSGSGAIFLAATHQATRTIDNE